MRSSVILSVFQLLVFSECSAIQRPLRRSLTAAAPSISTATGATTVIEPISGSLTSQCAASRPTDVTSYTADITVARSAAPAASVIGQPDWDFSNLNHTQESPIQLSISTNGGNQSSPTLYGLILEDIDHCIDGGLYAEAVQNRAFQNKTLEAWYSVGGSCISLGYNEPLSSTLPAHLSIDLKSSGDGFGNIGWWGFSVRPVSYRFSFWARTTSSNSFRIKAALVSASSRTEFASTQLTIANSTWTKYTATLNPSTTAPNTNNVLEITSVSNTSDTLHFNLISLFQPTYNNRPNGVRADLMQNLKDLNLKYCRVPGGNNLEGSIPSKRWKWNETIGPLKDRPGRPGDWGYYNTDGMGLFEWLQFCEDLMDEGGETLLGVYSGYSLSGVSVSESDLQPYITDALAELEYVLGPADSKYGALRAHDGRANPFDVKYIEIGNEDFFSDTYGYRFPAFYAALKTAYPNVTFVATTTKGIHLPAGVQFDQHFYGSSNDFLGLFSAYDNWPRANGTDILAGEYSVQRFDNQTFSTFPFMQGSVAEAVFGLGIERNADVVKTQLYAPFLSNLHYNREGKPRLISFDVDEGQTVLSTSYQVLKLLSTTHPLDARGLEVEASEAVHPVYWAASEDVGTEVVYVKLANAGEEEKTVAISGADEKLSCSKGTVVTGTKLAMNTPQDGNVVGLKDLAVKSTGNGTQVTLPAWSVAVVQCSSS